MGGNLIAAAARAWTRLTPPALTQAYLLLMAGVFPLFFTLSGYGGITRAKALFFFSLSGLYLLLLLLRLLAAKARPAAFAGLRRIGWAERAALALAALALLSAIASPYGWGLLLGLGRYDGLLPLLLYIALFIAVSRFGRLKPALLAAAALAALVSGSVALLQLAGYNPLALYPAGYDYYDAGLRYSGAFLGLIGNADVLAAWYVLIIPLLLGAAWRLRFSLSKRLISLLLPAALLSLCILTASGVAGGLLGLGLGLMLALPLLLPLNSAHWRRIWLPLLLLIALALLLMLYFGDFRPEQGLPYEASHMLHGDFDDSFGSSRLGIWRQTLALIAGRPLLGGGPGSIAARLDMVFSRVSEAGVMLATRVDNAHNVYLQLAADLGLPALAAYLALLGALFASWLRRGRERGSVAALGAAILCYALQDSFNLGSILVQPLFWLLAGLLVAESKAQSPVGAGS